MNKEELLFALRGRVNSGDRFVKKKKLVLEMGGSWSCLMDVQVDVGVGWGSGSSKARA